jgi:hypothetical protein
MHMILIRDVFRLKFGKARDAVALWKEMAELGRRTGRAGSPRAMTDLVGPYYTMAMEMTFPDLAAWEKEMHATMDSEWRALYQKFTPLVDSGYREIFTLLDV